MSFPDIDSAMRRRGLPPAEKLVLVSLAWRVNHKTGQCNPSIATIAADTGLGETTARAAVKGLEAKGLLRVKRGGSPNGGRVSNSYRLTSPPQQLRWSTRATPSAASVTPSDSEVVTPSDSGVKPPRHLRSNQEEEPGTLLNQERTGGELESDDDYAAACNRLTESLLSHKRP